MMTGSASLKKTVENPKKIPVFLQCSDAEK
jgi:hypothetical protein